MMADAPPEIDAWAYRHRVADLMTPEPAAVAPSASLAAAAELMRARGISSVLVDLAGERGGPGIVTERDLMLQVARHGAGAPGRSCGEVMSAPLRGVGLDDHLHVAIGRMARLGLRHLVVFDHAGRPCGILTARTLLRHRSEVALVIGDELSAADDAEGLRAAHGRLPAMAEALRAEGLGALRIAAVIAAFYRDLTRRACEIAEADGNDGLPTYAMLVLGSGGRGEALLAGDQDNAIVHNLPDGADERPLAALAARVNALLDEAGLPLCKGGVMASNPAWRRSLADWRAAVDGWASRAHGESLLNVDIFFDAVCVHGDRGLHEALRDDALAAARRPLLPRMMAEEVQGFRPPLGLLGGLRTEQGRVDLKLGGLFPLVAGARAMALRHGIAATSTRERLAAIAARGLMADDDLAAFGAAHDIVLDAILDQQIADLRSGLPPSSRVEASRLGRAGRRRLCDALRVVARLPALVLDVTAHG